MTQGMTISEQAKPWRRRFSTSLPPSMILLWSSVSWVVTRGGMVAVGARCVCGRPLAVVTRPLLPGVCLPYHLLFDLARKR